MGSRIKEVFILQLHLTLYDSHYTVGCTLFFYGHGKRSRTRF